MLPNAKSFFIVKGRLLGGVDDVLGLLHADLRHNRNTNGDVFRNVVLLGDVGCGRTTVARAFCRMMRAEGIVADDTLTELSARNDAYNFTNLVLSAPEGGVLVTEAADMLPTHVGMLATLHARKRHVIVISDTKAQLENWWQADQCGDACAGWLERTISLPSWPATRCLAMLVDRICDIDFVDKDDAVRTLDNALVDATISPRFRNARDVVRLSEALRARRGPISKEIVRDIVKDFIAPFIVARVDRRIELAAAAPANNDAVPMVPDELPEDDIAPLVPPAMFDIAVAPAAVCVSSDAPPELRQRHNKPYEDSPLCPSDMYEIMKI